MYQAPDWSASFLHRIGPWGGGAQHNGQDDAMGTFPHDGFKKKDSGDRPCSMSNNGFFSKM